MDIADTSNVINALNDAAGGAPETWRVEMFTMNRESSTHGQQDVTVRILDRGPEISPRYHVSAETTGGQHCTGNSGDDLDTTIRWAHWDHLDL